MSSFSQVCRLELAVFGYVRRLEKSSVSNLGYIPEVVKELIIAYARNCFSWYTEKHGTGYRFFENNTLQAEKIEACYSFLASANILSLEVCRKFEWEITIIETKVENNADISLMIGFIEYPMETSIINNWDTYFDTKHHFGVGAYSENNYLTKFGRDKLIDGSQFAENKEYHVKNGDRFCIRFDFEESKCSFGYNDEFTADVYTNIPSKIIPTVCIYDPMIFACTKWNEIFEESSKSQII